MKQVVIENPVINSPFVEPQRHFKFSEDGITDEIIEARRISSYFIPIPQPRKKNLKQLSFDTEWTADRIEENKFINHVRERVAIWRQGNYQGVTNITRRLLEYWTNPQREHRLFFCQIEALETAIYISEVAGKYGDAWIESSLKEANQTANPLLYRIAFKMATGSGKTLVIAMLIAWQTLNKLANPKDGRFSDAFLISTPGITIRDRLQVLMPSDPNNYYHLHDLVPVDLLPELGKAKLVITNFHAFMLHERISAGKLTKEILTQGETNPFIESPDQMVRRVCRELGNKRNIVVINDEAHHCYRHKPEDDFEKLIGDERREVEKREEQARIWISGLEAVKNKISVKAIYDLSATPFFLRGSGYPEGTLFPWVVSDFSLIDAIESGIVKVPRVPISDDSMTGELPTYRDIWPRIREHLPKKGRKSEAVGEEPNLPVELEGALQSLYSNYARYYALWNQDADALSNGLTPPVFIVVCNNTNVSRMVYNYIAGWQKFLSDGSTVVVPGKLSLLTNVSSGSWLPRPNTILVDSEQLESGEALSDEFKNIAATEIERFKEEYKMRFPGRDTDSLTDEDLLREVMNTVGKPGRLGERVKCVVSVSMLTEGWDASTVTHILGVRAFGTQLLCEQVVGRGLRRMSHAVSRQTLELNGHIVEFDAYLPEYAEVYGVPFSFIPCSGSNPEPKPPARVTHVRALDSRQDCEITFPRVIGYRYDIQSEKLSAVFGKEAQMMLSTQSLPTQTEMASILGESKLHTLYGLKERREHEIDFRLASLVLENFFRDDDGNSRPWLFPQLLKIARQWRENCVSCKDNAFPQMLLLTELAHEAAEHIYQSITATHSEQKLLRPIMRPYDPVGSTRYVDFDTVLPTWTTDPAKCHVSHVVADTGTWEQKVAQSLEEMPEVLYYVKNQNMGFYIPYIINGEEHNYEPDFIARVETGGEPLNLIIEVSGREKKEKAAKTATARNLWVPAVNNHGGFKKWAFLEVTDPWNVKTIVKGFLDDPQNAGTLPLFIEKA
jgi:type III restriction enzyme